jgi:hypothetical protein
MSLCAFKQIIQLLGDRFATAKASRKPEAVTVMEGMHGNSGESFWGNIKERE